MSFSLLDKLKHMTSGNERKDFEQMRYLLADTLQHSGYAALSKLGDHYQKRAR